VWAAFVRRLGGALCRLCRVYARRYGSRLASSTPGARRHLRARRYTLPWEWRTVEQAWRSSETPGHRGDGSRSRPDPTQLLTTKEVGLTQRWRDQARSPQRDVYSLYFAVRGPRVPWYAKALAAGLVAYAFSPIDLIPDFIPVLGYLDELVLVPLGVLAVRALIPPAILAECRARADHVNERPRSWIASGVIVAVWVIVAAASVYFALLWFQVQSDGSR
jgi:uncharacterized membrane protein YkvA (DUF1232 family)